MTLGAEPRVVHADSVPEWPAGRRGNVVLQSDSVAELGGPQAQSVSLLLWTEAHALVRDALITIAGPDLGENCGAPLPFARAVILEVEGFDEGNCVQRHKELELLRYDLNLDGYMMRTSSQNRKEWGRVSRRAVEAGFSLATLGAGLIRLYRSIPYVCAVETILVTSSCDAVESLMRIDDTASRRIHALDKRTTESTCECDECDFNDVCDEVGNQRAARNAQRERTTRV